MGGEKEAKRRRKRVKEKHPAAFTHTQTLIFFSQLTYFIDYIFFYELREHLISSPFFFSINLMHFK